MELKQLIRNKQKELKVLKQKKRELEYELAPLIYLYPYEQLTIDGLDQKEMFTILLKKCKENIRIATEQLYKLWGIEKDLRKGKKVNSELWD